MGLYVEVFSSGSITESISVGSILAVVLAFHISTLQNLTLPSFKTEKRILKELTLEMKEMDAAQDYIHELIEAQ